MTNSTGEIYMQLVIHYILHLLLIGLNILIGERGSFGYYLLY